MSNPSYRLRRAHRFLGVSVGIQLLFWTLSGLYFSWIDLDFVHGDFQKKSPPALLANPNDSICSPMLAVKNLERQAGRLEIKDFRLVNILGKNYWQIAFVPASGAEHRLCLADAMSGELRPPLTEAEAVELAKNAFNGEAAVKNIEYLTEASGHHEFRESPLPAFAVHFEHPTQTTIYVSAELGTVQKFRNSAWRVFDFLWMLHTMDYRTRDDINNWALRIFSVLGLLTVASGFVLFAITSSKKRAM